LKGVFDKLKENLAIFSYKGWVLESNLQSKQFLANVLGMSKNVQKDVFLQKSIFLLLKVKNIEDSMNFVYY
jgi:hypothetical protein